MPKITAHGGASNRHDPETAGAVTEPPASTAPAPDEGGTPSPGTSSSTSSEKPETSSGPSDSETPSRARRTANRSKKAQTEDSSAPSTDGGLTAPTSDADSA